MSDLPQYRCHKTVQAAQITHMQIRVMGGARLSLGACGGVDVPERWMRKHEPHVGDYYVLAESGATSVVGEREFQAGYVPADEAAAGHIAHG